MKNKSLIVNMEKNINDVILINKYQNMIKNKNYKILPDNYKNCKIENLMIKGGLNNEKENS